MSQFYAIEMTKMVIWLQKGPTGRIFLNSTALPTFNSRQKAENRAQPNTTSNRKQAMAYRARLQKFDTMVAKKGLVANS